MIAQSLLSLAAGADTRSNYLIRLACRWADRADRAGLRIDRLHHLGEAWAILACPGVDSLRARREVCRAIVAALTPFELADLARHATAGRWALELGYTEHGVDADGVREIVYTQLGAEILAVTGPG